MEEPFAAVRTPEDIVARVAWEAGYTETSAPVSMRKGRPRRRQKRERDPEEATNLTEERTPEETGATVLRHARFPMTVMKRTKLRRLGAA